MLSGLVQKVIAYTKEVDEIGLYGIMADRDLFFLFSGSPLFFAMLPIIGIILTIQALINGYKLATASNRNFDKWLGLIVSGTCAALSSVALYGAVIASLVGGSFVVGPFFFLSSLCVGFGYQAMMFGLNLYKAYESTDEPLQHMHYLQAALNNLFVLGLLSAALGAVVFVMLTPIAPIIGSACALTAVGLTALNIVWKILPHNWKQFIKEQLNFGKPELTEQLEDDQSLSLTDAPVQGVHLDVENKHTRIFSQCDYSGQVKLRSTKAAASYLKQIIENKIAALTNPSVPYSEKNSQKAALLSDLISKLDGRHGVISKDKLLQQSPLVFQSFWADKGEVEQIFDAVMVLQQKYEQDQGIELTSFTGDTAQLSM